ncbi:putative reverse transcriptase domain-containing protein [Tanacetum coccineum]
MESELWNLTMKGNNVAAYTQRFQELSLLCPKMAPKEEDKIKRFVWGLLDSIQGNVHPNAARQDDNKIKWDNHSRDNHVHQQPFKRTNVARAYTARSNEKNPYYGSLPYCNKCKLHYTGPCTVKYENCKKCGKQGHYRSDCPKLKNQTHGNQAGNEQARGRDYALGGGGESNQDSNIVTSMFLLNNRYASMPFDTNADRSFVSTRFSSLIDIAPSAIDTKYSIELADGKIVGAATIIRGCTLNFLNHQFDIDLMPIELGSFNMIIGMYWLTKYHTVIICDEKLIRVNYRDEVLMIQGDRSEGGRNSKLNIISCTKTQKYIQRDAMSIWHRLRKRRLKTSRRRSDLKTCQSYGISLEVFPEDLPGLPPARQVEFQIELVPGAAPIVRV